MATIGTYFPNLVDQYKDSTEGKIAEILHQQNPILDDALATQCNSGTKHKHGIRTGLPEVSWGRLYKGVKQSKATTQQVEDTTGFLEARSEIDKRLLDLADDMAKARLAESAPFLEAMNQEMARGIFYHSTDTSPEKFQGLAARYGSIGGAGAGNQVIDGGGAGNDNTSIWFVTWGDHATSLLFPKGTKAGVSMEDKGEEPVKDADGNTYYAKVAMFNWHIGMFVKDWRYNARIANISKAAIDGNTVDVWALLRKAYYKLQSRRINAQSSRIAIYMNRDVLELLDAQSTDKSLTNAVNNYHHLTSQFVEGQEVKHYRGIPIRETDALLNTEQRVVAA